MSRPSAENARRYMQALSLYGKLRDPKWFDAVKLVNTDDSSVPVQYVASCECIPDTRGDVMHIGDLQFDIGVLALAGGTSKHYEVRDRSGVHWVLTICHMEYL